MTDAAAAPRHAAVRDERLAIAVAALWTAGAVAASRWGMWLGVGGAALVIGPALLVVDPLRLRGRLRPGPLPLVVGLVAGAAMCGFTYAAYPLAARAAPEMARAAGDLYAAFRALTPVQAAFALGPVIVGEELAWRGLVQGVLARRLGAAGGLLVAAVAYALAHAPAGSPLLIAVALACGLFWGLLRAASGSLLPPLIAHVMWDTSVLLLWPLARGSVV